MPSFHLPPTHSQSETRLHICHSNHLPIGISLANHSTVNTYPASRSRRRHAAQHQYISEGGLKMVIRLTPIRPGSPCMSLGTSHRPRHLVALIPTSVRLSVVRVFPSLPSFSLARLVILSRATNLDVAPDQGLPSIVRRSFVRRCSFIGLPLRPLVRSLSSTRRKRCQTLFQLHPSASASSQVHSKAWRRRLTVTHLLLCLPILIPSFMRVSSLPPHLSACYYPPKTKGLDVDVAVTVTVMSTL